MIKIENLNWKVEDGVIFNDFNLHIKKGEKIIFNTSSGSGKTSLLKFIGAFKKPDSGNILINDTKLNKANIHKIRPLISYVSQNIDLQDNILEEVLHEIFSYKINSHIKNYIEKFEQLARDFALINIKGKRIGTLSGGEKQRIAFIICLILNREIWLLDEITASLDYEMKEKVEEYILKSDKTILLVSHDKHWDMSKFRKEDWK
jgi:putative ABC transport system ATP-binding protein